MYRIKTRYVKNNALRRIAFVAGTPLLLVVNALKHIMAFGFLVALWFIKYFQNQKEFVFGPMVKFWNKPDCKGDTNA